MNLQPIDFAFPQAFWLIVPWVSVVGAVWWGSGLKKRSLQFWLSPDSLEKWGRRARLQVLLFSLATLFLIVALSRPRFAFSIRKVTLKGADLVICLDISHSMLCEDITPSRLEMGQTVISNLIRRLPPDDRVALVVFGGNAFPLSPLTSDLSLIELYLTLIDPSVLVQNPTTYIGKGLEVSLRLLQRKATDSGRGRMILLLSDGEDQGSDWKTPASVCRKEGIPIVSVALGTSLGSAVPNLDSSGQIRGYKRDREGRIVISRLNEQLLSEIGKMTGGKVLRPLDGNRETQQVIAELSRTRKQASVRSETEWLETFPFLLFLSLCLLVGEIKLRRSVD